jgi:hypothetical protein
MSGANLGGYTSIYEKIDETRKTTAEKYIKELQFMESQLKKLKKEIKESGAVDDFKQGAQEMKRESPAMKSYCTLIQRYGDIQKKLADLLPEKKDQAKEDAGEKLAAFIAKGKK